MDDRQTKIREGAGLEDSRVNQDFIDFLNKWSSPVLIVLAVGALVYAGLQYLDRRQKARIDRAFGEYEAAIAGGNPSPSSLESIASEPSNDVRSVPELALLKATDIYLEAAMRGVAPGAQIDPVTQTFSNPDDLLNDEQRGQYLDQAKSTAQKVYNACKDDPAKAVLTMQALSRLAAVAEGKKDFAQAKSYYEQLKSLGEKQQFEPIMAFADERIANLPSLESLQPLPTEAQVPPLNPPVETPESTSTPDPNAGSGAAPGADQRDGGVEQPANEPTSSDNP